MTPGDVVAEKYEIVSELGRGGMGVVYRVRHRGLETSLALKLLPAHLADEPTVRRRFHDEARVLARLSHPNLVRVFDVDEHLGQPYIVMECIEGADLAALLEREGALPLDRTLRLGREVADALAHAHQADPPVLHRDIKPSNILIEQSSGRAVVTDFGIATLLGEASPDVTQDANPLGTLRYTAPEFLRGDAPLDQSLDVYALGVVLYEAFTGDRFGGEGDERQVLANILGPTPFAPRFPPDTPSSVRALIETVIERKPSSRYRDATSLSRAIQEIRRELSTHLSSEPRARGSSPATLPPGGITSSQPLMRRRRNGPTVAIFLGVAAILGFFLAARQETEVGPAVPVQEGTISVLRFENQRPADERSEWYGRALQTVFNTELSKVAQLVVVAPELIARLAREQGIAPSEAARRLGVQRVVDGSFAVVGSQMRIDARVVETPRGVQTTGASVEGAPDEFFALQRRLTLSVLEQLSIEPSEEARSNLDGQAKSEPTRVDKLRLLMQAEGVGAGNVVPRTAPTNASPAEEPLSRAPAVDASLLVLNAIAPAPAYAQPDQETVGAIHDTLEQYRSAAEAGDVSRLADLFVEFTPTQRAGVQDYVEGTHGLSVVFSDIHVQPHEEDYVATYVRTDTFIDSGTGEEISLEVRLTKFLTRTADGWKFAVANRD